jgi:hypothetical protein
MKVQFTAVFRPVPGGYVGLVEELPGANTQGANHSVYLNPSARKRHG